MVALYPIFLNLKGKKCLVVGGGKVAQRKVKSLLDAGAIVKLISPDLTPELKKMSEQNKIDWENREFKDKDINVFLVISATNNKTLNKKIADLCAEKKILVNVIDNPQSSSFHVPANFKRGDLSIAISTGGNSPMLAAKIKEKLENEFGEEYETYLKLLGDLRKRVLEEIPEEEKRRKIFRRFVDSDLLQLVKSDNHSKIKERIEECIYS